MPFQILLGKKKYQFKKENISKNQLQLNRLINELQCLFQDSTDQSISGQLTLLQYQIEEVATQEYMDILYRSINDNTISSIETLATKSNRCSDDNEPIKNIVESIIHAPMNWVYFEKVVPQYRKNLLNLFYDIHTSRVNILFYLRCVCNDKNLIASLLKIKEYVDIFLYMHLKDTYQSVLKSSQEKSSRAYHSEFYNELKDLSPIERNNQIRNEYQRIMVCSEGLNQIFCEVFSDDISLHKKKDLELCC